MTNKEKLKEVFEKTFGFVPEDCFPCPEECPERFENRGCRGCPFEHFPRKEYKKPEVENVSDFSFETTRFIYDLASVLRKHSPIKESEIFSLICIFMDVVTDDNIPVDDDLAGVRMDIVAKFYESWPHSVEYYKKGDKE